MLTELQADTRDGQGRSDSRRLRREGKVPAVVYGGGKNPQAVTINHNLLLREMKQPAFYTSVLTVRVAGEAQAVVVKEVQRHPAKSYVMHLDFQRIVENEEITLHVPIHFIGEEISKGVKEQGGAIEHLATDLEVTCLPRNLPEFIEVDVTQLELNEIIHLSELKLPEGVSLVALQHHQDLPIVTITPPRREEAEESEEGAAGEAPTGEAET